MTSVCRQCPIWGKECPDEVFILHRPPGYRGGGGKVCLRKWSDHGLECKCLRAGGRFKVEGPSPNLLHNLVSGLDDEAKARLCGWIARENLVRDAIPIVNEESVARAESGRMPTMPERLDLALEWLVLNSRGRFGANPFVSGNDTMMLGKKVHAFMAFSFGHGKEDDLHEEFIHILNSLGDKVTHYQLKGGHVDRKSDRFYGSLVSAAGFARYEELRKSVDSSRVFVAMWFGKDMDAVYDEAIAPAVRAAGYEPVRVDRVDHLGKIDDEIIAQIRRARFVVADFTAAHLEKPRGGVYYEAGFAYGLGREVIYTCRADFVEALHFDTRQFNHLVWEADKLPDFRKALQNRIERAIGQGPKLPEPKGKAGE